MEGKIVYCTGRSYIDSKPKYLNYGSSKNLVLYNYDNINSEEIILCEGIISSVNATKTTGVQSTVLAGKTLSSEGIRLLKKKGIKKIYLSVDGDVSSPEINRIIRQLFNNMFEVYFISLPDGMDPDDCGPDFKKYFDNSKKVWFVG